MWNRLAGFTHGLMATHFKMKHSINCTPDVFWEKIVREEAFNEALYKEELGFGYALLDEGPPRRARIEPRMDAPKAIQKVLGDNVSFVEVGGMQGERYEFVIEPSTLSSKLTIKGAMDIVANGESKCYRCVEFTIEAKIFGVGKILEAFIAKETKDRYEGSARFTNVYLDRAGWAT